jgi:hypothetical protein
LLLMNAVSIYQGYAVEKKEQWRDAAAYVDSKAGPGQMVLFNAGFTETPFRYYDKSELPGRGYPFDEALVHESPEDSSDLAKTTQGFATVWLVLSHSADVDGDGKVTAWLDSNARLTEQRSFREIKVLRYEKGQGSNAPQSPTRR